MKTTHLATFADVHKLLETCLPGKLTHRQAYTLEYMELLMEHLGNPQNKLRVIHIVGTSGKTSTAYYAAALLKAAGHRVGLTVSPHLDEINERLQIDLMPLEEKKFCHDFSQFMSLLDDLPFESSYFELVVAFVYWEFVRLGVEYAVVEVGMGGLIDGTNVINRADKVAVITDIGFDHTRQLGNTLGEIAAQKAGIIQLHNAVFCYQQLAEIMKAITTRAAQKQADLHVLHAATDQSHFAFLPLFQQRNFGLSLQAVQHVLARDGKRRLTDAQIETAARQYVPGRMDIRHIGDHDVIMDGAHNSQKMRAFVESIVQRYPRKKRAALVTFVASGDARAPMAMEELLPHIDHLIITTYHSVQGRRASVTPEEIVSGCRRAGFTNYEIIPDYGEAYATLLERSEPVLLVTGSLYLLSYLRTQQPSQSH